MARPREFDETAALEAAMNCFWAEGYEASSVRHLVEQMGITGASLYNAFGDKRALYRQALRHYLEHTVRGRVARFEPLAPGAALRGFFHEIVERSLADSKHRGCMLVNAAIELAPYDSEIHEIVRAEMAFIEGFLRRCLERGQTDGTISTVRPAAELAGVLLSVLVGIRVLARIGPQRRTLEDAAHGALEMLTPVALE